MKKHILLAPVVGLILGLGACTKDTPTPTIPNNNNNNNNNSSSSTPPSPTVANVYGAMIAIKMTTTTTQMGYSFDVSTDMGVAAFYNNLGATTLVDAGDVSINSNKLTKAENNSYTKLATIGMTPASLDLDGDNNWSVAGKNGVSALTYNYTAAFPDYTGTIPSTVTKSSGVSIDLSSVTNADSVYVFIASGNTSVLKRYSQNVGNVTISASDLSILPASTTALMEVVPFRTTVRTINGKDYAFIKERAAVKTITIN